MENDNDIQDLVDDLNSIGFGKPNCYKCKFRKELGWSAHSQCKALEKSLEKELNVNTEILGLLMLSGRIETPKGVKFHEHGIRNGWANWPSNFDPAWLEACDYFEKHP